MTSRERLLNTIFHKPTDRVPISLHELNGYDPLWWNRVEPSYAKVIEAIDRDGDYIAMIDPIITYPAIEPLKETRTWRAGDSNYKEVNWHTPKGDLKQCFREFDGIVTTWQTEHLLKDIDDIDKYLSLDFSNPSVDMTPVREGEKWLGERGILMPSLLDSAGRAADLFEMSDYLVNCYDEPEKIAYFQDALHEILMEELRLTVLGAVPDMMIRICGPEYCTPPYLPERMFHEKVTRYVAPMTELIESGGCIPRVHCHGHVRNALKELADYTATRVIDPMEPIPDGDISLKEAKQLYGNRFTLMGDIEVREFEHATPERVDALVKRAMEDAKKGGGFIIIPSSTPCCLPLTEIAERNLLQYIESALKYGKY